MDRERIKLKKAVRPLQNYRSKKKTARLIELLSCKYALPLKKKKIGKLTQAADL